MMRFFALFLVFIASPAFADVDYTCLKSCTAGGKSNYECMSTCSYNIRPPTPPSAMSKKEFAPIATTDKILLKQNTAKLQDKLQQAKDNSSKNYMCISQCEQGGLQRAYCEQHCLIVQSGTTSTTHVAIKPTPGSLLHE